MIEDQPGSLSRKQLSKKMHINHGGSPPLLLCKTPPPLWLWMDTPLHFKGVLKAWRFAAWCNLRWNWASLFARFNKATGLWRREVLWPSELADARTHMTALMFYLPRAASSDNCWVILLVIMNWIRWGLVGDNSQFVLWNGPRNVVIAQTTRRLICIWLRCSWLLFIIHCIMWKLLSAPLIMALDVVEACSRCHAECALELLR